MDLMERAALAQKAARAAGEMIRTQRNFKITNKSEKDYVTEMDVKSETLIREILLSACPEDEFYGEEGGGSKNEMSRWIVDPIDGTTNYIRGIAFYTISIAYEQDGQLMIGCVYCPELDEMYVAVRGHGATLNGEKLQVQQVDKMTDAIVGMSFAHRNEANNRRTMALLPGLVKKVNDLRRMGSAAYDLCCVASGRYHGFFELGLNIYDIAAGIVIVEEAGGFVRDWQEGGNVLESGDIIAGGKFVFDFLCRELNGEDA